MVAQQIVDVVVADPSHGTEPVGTLERVRRDFPSLPVVLYTTLRPAGMKAIIRLARSGVEHVVLYRFDDEPRRFRRLLEGVPGHALGERMLHELSEALGRLPVTVVRAVEDMFRSPDEFKTVQDLAEGAGMNTRTLYRNLESAGLHSPRALVVAARLIQVHAYLRDPGRSIKDVAAKTGYRTPWQLSQQMREMTGITTEEARRELTGEQLVSVLAEQIRRRRR
jgi:AraC-like DNA-binding protein